MTKLLEFKHEEFNIWVHQGNEKFLYVEDEYYDEIYYNHKTNAWTFNNKVLDLFDNKKLFIEKLELYMSMIDTMENSFDKYILLNYDIFLLYEINSLLVKLTEDEEYCDNFRFAFADNEKEVEKYNKYRNNGCCGFVDETFTLKDGREIFLGFNCGH